MIIISIKIGVLNVQRCKNEEIYNEWTHFINDEKYKKYFI